MAVVPAEQLGSLVATVPHDADGELLEESFAARAGLLGGPKPLGRRLALGTALAVAAVAAMALVLRQGAADTTADVTALEVAAQKAKGIKSFHQCGGKSWSGGTCCERGCACIIENAYYSICKVPKGGNGECDMNSAKAEVQEFREMAGQTKPAAEKAKKAAETSRAAEKKAKKELGEAQAALKKAKKAGMLARKAKAAKESEETDAKKAAEDAAKAAQDKIDRYSEVKKEIDDIETTAALRSHGKCGKRFSSCGPVSPPKLTEYMACCQEGCICKWQNKFYAECQNPSGKGDCDPAAEEAHVSSQKALMAKLQEEHTKLETKKQETKEHYDKVHAEADEIRHKAAAAGAARKHANKVMQQKKSAAARRTSERVRKEKAAKHAEHMIHYTAVGIEAWEQAAAGGHCGAGGSLDSATGAADEDAADGAADGPADGAADGAADVVADSAADSAADGTADGTAGGVADGAADDSEDGAPSGPEDSAVDEAMGTPADGEDGAAA